MLNPHQTGGNTAFLFFSGQNGFTRKGHVTLIESSTLNSKDIDARLNCRYPLLSKSPVSGSQTAVAFGGFTAPNFRFIAS